jgi:hypothetical protein
VPVLSLIRSHQILSLRFKQNFILLFKCRKILFFGCDPIQPANKHHKEHIGNGILIVLPHLPAHPSVTLPLRTIIVIQNKLIQLYCHIQILLHLETLIQMQVGDTKPQPVIPEDIDIFGIPIALIGDPRLVEVVGGGAFITRIEGFPFA